MLTLFTLGHLDDCGADQPVAQHVATRELFDDLAITAALRRLVSDRLMKVRIEIGPERLDRLDAALAQDVEELAMDELDALAIGFRAVGAGIGLQRPFEIVDERKEITDDVGRDRFGCALTVAFYALAVIVEFGRLAEQPIVIVVALLLELVGVDDR